MRLGGREVQKPILKLGPGLLGAGGFFDPGILFTSGEQGYIYDNNDLASFYSDSAMTTQAVVNGPVGGQRDKSPNANHRTQATAASRPTLRGTPTGANLVSNGDFSGGTTTGWTPNANATLSVVSGAMRITATAGGIATYASTPIATTAGRVYRIQVRYVTDGSTGNAFVYVGTAPGQGDVSATNLGSTVGTYTIYFTATTATSYLSVSTTSVILAAEYNEWDNVDVRDVSISSVTAPYGIHYDGVDDFLQTASVNFTATDSMNVCMGVRKLSDAAQGIVVEFSVDTAANNGSFRLTAPGGAATPSYSFLSKGTVAQSPNSTSFYAAPITNVITGIADISSDIATIRTNGTAVTNVGDQGTGNYGNYPLYFGRRAGTSIPFNGLDFGGVCINRTLSAADLTSTERWVGVRTGVAL